MEIDKKQNIILKHKELILDLQNKIKNIESDIFNDVKNIMLQTNFVEVKTKDNIKEFYYILKAPTEQKWYVTGIKLDDKKEHQIGVINIEHIKECKDVKSIEPHKFFYKSKNIKINWETNDITKECLKYKPNNIINDGLVPVVGYCRLSQHNKNNLYDRQKNSITKKSLEDGCIVDEFFCETLSGDTPFNKRKEILSMIEYCSIHNINKIYISEFNRMGRSSKTILDGIKFLRKNGILSINVILENITIDENFITNNYKELKAFCKKAEEDRQNIIDRLNTGRDAYKEKIKQGLSVKPMGRPTGSKLNEEHFRIKYYKDIELLTQGVSYRKITTITGTSTTTLQRLNKMFNCKIN